MWLFELPIICLHFVIAVIASTHFLWVPVLAFVLWVWYQDTKEKDEKAKAEAKELACLRRKERRGAL
jgi:hypothetical protein